MSLLGTLAAMLPMPARDLAGRWRDQWRLSRATPELCSDASLGRVDRAWLSEVLCAPNIDAEWPGIAQEIDRFQITTSAGGVNPGDRRALYYLLRALRPARVLEVGTHIGASTVHIAAALRANARAGGPTADATTVDIQDVNDPITRPWIRYGSRQSPADMVTQLGLLGAVRFVAQPSLAFLVEQSEGFDLIFLDGDHSAATVYREVPAALRRLRPGGLILLHDYFPDGAPLWPGDPVIAGPWLGMDRLRREGAKLDVVPLGNLPWPTKLGANVTSLALVTRAA